MHPNPSATSFVIRSSLFLVTSFVLFARFPYLGISFCVPATPIPRRLTALVQSLFESRAPLFSWFPQQKLLGSKASRAQLLWSFRFQPSRFFHKTYHLSRDLAPRCTVFHSRAPLRWVSAVLLLRLSYFRTPFNKLF
jgi:hypothetical protein